MPTMILRFLLLALFSTGRTLAMAISGVLVRKRLVWTAYYLSLEGEETVARLRVQSDAFVMGMLEAS